MLAAKENGGRGFRSFYSPRPFISTHQNGREQWGHEGRLCNRLFWLALSGLQNLGSTHPQGATCHRPHNGPRIGLRGRMKRKGQCVLTNCRQKDGLSCRSDRLRKCSYAVASK